MNLKTQYFQKQKKRAPLFEQAHTESQETVEFSLTQPSETFKFTPPLNRREQWSWFLLVTEGVPEPKGFFSKTQEINLSLSFQSVN